MSTTTIITIVCFSIVILIALLFAFLYLFRSRFMPYHADAVERSWEEVDEKIRVLVIALMRVAGGGWLAGSFAIYLGLYVYICYREPLAILAISITGLAVAIPTLLATLIVKRRTKATPPVFAVVFAIVLILAGLSVAMLGTT